MSHNVAIDGPAGAGKSTIAKRIARRLGYIYVDTGAMYRAMAYYLIQNQVDAADKEAIAAACQHADISICYQDGEQVVLLNGENVNAYLRTESVGNMASVSSVVPEVRKKLVELQQKLARETDVVMDGRDIGTVVLPNAQVKIYLTAAEEERARRRFAELQKKGTAIHFEEVLAEVKLRDKNDMNRPVAPLRQAPDAVLVDTSHLDFDQSVQAVLSVIEERIGLKRK